MVKLRMLLALSITAALTGSATAASAVKKPFSSPAAKGSIVSDHIPEFDGPMTTLTGPDGRTWAVWTFRATHESDVAVSSREASATTWTAPVFFGRRSGFDEIDPTIAVDSRGTVYVAFATANPPRVAVATLTVGSAAWSEPIIVSGTEAASAPAMLFVGDRLIVAYRTARGVGMVDLPTIGGGNQIDGIQDTPESVDPLGIKGDRTPIGPAIPASSRVPGP